MSDKSEKRRVTIYARETQTGVRAALLDLWTGLRLVPIWRAFAYDEIQNRYRRSAIGVAWIAIAYLVFVFAIVIFFRGFALMDGTGFFQHVAIGFAAFTFLISNLVDGCTVFSGAAPWIKSSSLPYSIYIYKSIARSIFPFVIQLTIAFIILSIAGWRLPSGAYISILALMIYFICAVPLQLLLGLLAARWRDVKHLINALTRMVFFITPILWVYGERDGRIQLIADFNPFTHFVEIFRAPLIGDPVALKSWIIVLAWTTFIWVLSMVAAGFMRHRLPIWV